MPDIWPLNPWGFARLIEPRKCCAYLAWYDIRPVVLVSPAAERRISRETMRDEPNANDVTWPVYAEAAFERRAQRLRANARHLIRTVLPHRVRNALRTGQYLVTGVRADGSRAEIADDDLAGLSVDLASDCLIGATVVFERISIRPKRADPRSEAPRHISPMLSRLVVPEGNTGLRDALCAENQEQPPDPEDITSRLLPVADAIDEAVQSMALSVEIISREIIKAVRNGHLSLFGRGPDSVHHAIPSTLLRDPDTSKIIVDGHSGRSQLTLTSSDASAKVEYIDLAVERDSFAAWLYLTKPKDLNSTPSARYVSVSKALHRLRGHIEGTEGRVPGEDELARIIAEDASRGHVKIHQVDDRGHSLPVAPESWISAQLPASAPAEKLILNGAVKGQRLVFLRAEFARWLGDRPDEANPTPKKLEHRDAAPIPLIAREWSREPGAEPEEKIAGRLWRAYFDGEFAFQIVADAPADFDRESFSAMIDINKEGERAVLGPAPRDDPEFGYRALGIWAAEGFLGMSPWFRLATVESYLLPRSELTRWCARAGQAMPRFWPSAENQSVLPLQSRATASRAPSEKTLRSWYKKRVTAFERTGKQPSREEDYRDAIEELGPGITHQRMRAIRAELAPHWTRRGRRPNKIGSK